MWCGCLVNIDFTMNYDHISLFLAMSADWVGFLDDVHDFIKVFFGFIFPVIPLIIFIAFCSGIYFFVKALRSISRSQEGLNRANQSLASHSLFALLTSDIKIKDFPGKLLKPLEVIIKDEKIIMGESHLLVRIEAIQAAVKVGAADKQIALPSLEDLHQLTLQEEMSKSYSFGMNTIISTLLILGILGTLTGVHGVISGSNSYGGSADGMQMDINHLQAALCPSILAVLGTIILMLLRGLIYRRKVEQFICQLDELTVYRLFPYFRHAGRDDEIGDYNDKLGEIVQKLGKSVEDAKAVKAQAEKLRNKMEEVLK
jgi:hypothetical protein